MDHRFAVEHGSERRNRVAGIRRALPRAWHWAVVAAIIVELLVRGPVRALTYSRDLTWHYGAARAWIQGRDPYDGRDVADAFDAGGGPPEMRPTGATVYPPVTLPLQAVLGVVSWRTAVIVFTTATLALVVHALLRLARHAGITDGRAAVATFGALALAPLHTGLGTAQMAIPSAAMLMIGWTLREESPLPAGMLLAVGAALKPSLALPFLVAAAVRPSARIIVTACVTVTGLFAVGVARLHATGHDAWVEGWLRAIRNAAEPGGMNYVRPENGGSIPMIHLEMLLWRITSVPSVVTAVSLAATVPVLVFAAWRLRVARDRGTELLALAALCVGSLLLTYHRTYDAFLLAVPLAAVLGRWCEISTPLRWALIASIAMFLQPGAPLLQVLAETGRIPRSLLDSAVWRVLIFPHQVWALASLQLLLVVVLARRPMAPR